MESLSARAAARALVKKHHTRDPFHLCEQKGITLLYRSDFVRQKGAFYVILQQDFIFINANLSEQMQRIVCAHELGHALLHRREALEGQVLVEYSLFNLTNRLEREANLFAAALLLDEEEVLTLLQEGTDAVSIAQQMDVNVNLVLLLLHAMQQDGLPLHLPPLPRGGFLQDLQDEDQHL